MGTIDRQRRRGRPRSVRISENVEDLVLGQEDNPKTHRSIREISRETGIHRLNEHRTIHRDLQLKCVKRRRAQELSEANRVARLTRCKQLLKRYSNPVVDFIWFTNEKVFTVEPPFNCRTIELCASWNQEATHRCQPAVCYARAQHSAGDTFDCWK